MERDDQFSRRRLLQFTGAAAATTMIAGCADEGPGEEDEDDPAEDDDPAADDEENGDEENGDEENGEVIDPDEEIELGGEVQAWMGQAPDQIADEENPTLVLQEGESYDITWENLDGQIHNIEIVDEDDEVVDDYETEDMDEEGETQTLEVDEVTDEMYEYVCRPHEGTMRASIEVETNGNGDEDEEEEDDEENADEENGDEENGDENDE